MLLFPCAFLAGALIVVCWQEKKNITQSPMHSTTPIPDLKLWFFSFFCHFSSLINYMYLSVSHNLSGSHL